MKKISVIIVSLLFICLFAFPKAQSFTLLSSTQIQSATTTNSTAISVGDYTELTIFLNLTAQGSYDNETMDVYVQSRSPSGNWVDLTDTSFTQVGNKVGSVPFRDELSIVDFGSWVRLRIVTTGNGVDYTVEFTAYAKK